MPTVAEMDLLTRSLGGLANTFQQNRAIKQREREWDLDREMRREMMTSDQNFRRQEGERDREFRQTESGKDRELRQNELQENRDWRAEMKNAQAIANAEQREARIFQILGEMNQHGALTEEGLATMQGMIEKKFGQAGIGVKLFRIPPANRAGQSTEAQNLALAEEYRRRANTAASSEEASRLTSIAARLERGGTPARAGSAKITRQVGKIDPISGKGEATIEQDFPMDALDVETRRLMSGGESASQPPAAGVYTRDSGGRLVMNTGKPRKPRKPRVAQPSAPVSAADPTRTPQPEAGYLDREHERYLDSVAGPSLLELIQMLLEGSPNTQGATEAEIEARRRKLRQEMNWK